MYKKAMVFMFILLFTIPIPANAIMKQIPNDTKDYLTFVIKSNNYVCTHCNDGYYLGETERGGLFKIMCDDSKYVYRLIVQPNKNIIVTPWYE